MAKLKCLKAGQMLTANVQKPNLNAGVAITPHLDKPPAPALNAKIPYQRFEVNAAMLQVLANYNFQIIMDRSLSMQQKDCPGDYSRWDWCGVQTTDLAKALSAYVTKGLTLVPFNAGFDVFDNASPQTIVDIFNDRSFILGTRLCEPLTFLLDRYFKERKPDSKPLLIVVITDGEPWPTPEPVQVKDELVSASSQINYENEANVVFLQIGGNDKHGRDYLDDLGQNLTSAGARYQYVHTVTFETLVRIGLAEAIVETVKAHQAAFQKHLNSTKNTTATSAKK